MPRSSSPHAFGAGLLLFCGVVAAAGTACSSNKDAGSSGGCSQNALTILFNPMYSAYDGMHTFQLPAVLNGIDPNQVKIDWNAEDPSMVKLQPDPTTGGVMLTMQKAGNTKIFAHAGSLCGVSPLTITSSTPDDWAAGSARYNDGVVISTTRPPGGGPPGGGPPGGGGGGMGGAGGAAPPANQAACTNCHGDTANGPFKTVQHTPEQTGGFSDDDLIGIFKTGVVPKDGYFDANIVPYSQWMTFHQWDVGGQEKGMVTYLRSLTPAAQTGMSNFGGRFDGGLGDGPPPMFDGGFPGRDGGGPPPGRDGGGFGGGGGLGGPPGTGSGGSSGGTGTGGMTGSGSGGATSTGGSTSAGGATGTAGTSGGGGGGAPAGGTPDASTTG